MWPRRSSRVGVWGFLCVQGWSQKNPNGPLASFPNQECFLLFVLVNGMAGFLGGLLTTMGSAYGVRR